MVRLIPFLRIYVAIAMNIIIYFISVNLFSFLFMWINIFIDKRHKNNSVLNIICQILSTLGGCFGIIISFLIFSHKLKKDNMTLIVTSLCLTIIYTIVLLILLLPIELTLSDIKKAVTTFYKPLDIYLLIINIVSFIVYGVDKRLAIKNKSRISIVTLLSLAGIGGSVGSLLGMYIFRHKTKKSYFTVGVPLILLTQIILIVFIKIIII